MPGEWITLRIAELGRVVTGKTPPTADHSNFGGPYPFITIPDLDGRVFIDKILGALEKTASSRKPEIYYNEEGWGAATQPAGMDRRPEWEVVFSRVLSR